MRIVHTSDWHAGRLWKSQNRLDELQNVLEHLGDFVERERIDLLLMSGDIFESQMPSAEAERAVSSFFKRLGRADVPSVVIAGNHDHPHASRHVGTARRVRRRAGPRAAAAPAGRRADRDIHPVRRHGLVAALPWAPPGRIVEALTLARDETQARQQYADAMQQILAHLAEGFQRDAVNLIVAHSYIAGAKGCGSERVVTMGDDWAATAQSLPATAQYVALGHIHRPQRVDRGRVAHRVRGIAAATRLRRGGRGEELRGDRGGARPAATVERVPYQGGKSLGTWEGTLPELEQQAGELKRFGFLRVKVILDTPMPDLNRRARQILPNIVVVDAVLPETSSGPGPGPDSIGPQPPVEQFRAYYLREHQCQPQPATIDLFNDLYQSAFTE